MSSFSNSIVAGSRRKSICSLECSNIALGWIGEDAVAAMPVLIQVLQDGGQDIPDPAEMLGPIESVDPVKPVVEMLLKLIPALKNDWEYVRPSAASTRG